MILSSHRVPPRARIRSVRRNTLRVMGSGLGSAFAAYLALGLVGTSPAFSSPCPDPSLQACQRIKPCQPSKFEWVKVCPTATACPDGTAPDVRGADKFCLFPTAADGSFNCVTKSSAFFRHSTSPASFDPIEFNHYPLRADGTWCTDPCPMPRQSGSLRYVPDECKRKKPCAFAKFDYVKMCDSTTVCPNGEAPRLIGSDKFCTFPVASDGSFNCTTRNSFAFVPSGSTPGFDATEYNFYPLRADGSWCTDPCPDPRVDCTLREVPDECKRIQPCALAKFDYVKMCDSTTTCPTGGPPSTTPSSNSTATGKYCLFPVANDGTFNCYTNSSFGFRPTSAPAGFDPLEYNYYPLRADGSWCTNPCPDPREPCPVKASPCDEAFLGGCKRTQPCAFNRFNYATMPASYAQSTCPDGSPLPTDRRCLFPIANDGTFNCCARSGFAHRPSTASPTFDPIIYNTYPIKANGDWCGNQVPLSEDCPLCEPPAPSPCDAQDNGPCARVQPCEAGNFEFVQMCSNYADSACPDGSPFLAPGRQCAFPRAADDTFNCLVSENAGMESPFAPFDDPTHYNKYPLKPDGTWCGDTCPVPEECPTLAQAPESAPLVGGVGLALAAIGLGAGGLAMRRRSR